MNITELLNITSEMGASDLHLTVGVPPTLRINGLLNKLDYPDLSEDDVFEMIYSLLSEEHRKKFVELKEIDFSLEIVNGSRFRVNVFMHRRGIAGAFRLIPEKIKSLEELGLPLRLADFTRKPKGLVLITGPTGSGKSTSLAAMINLINKTLSGNIITLEDPIEYLHRHGTCIINQREVGTDCPTFAQGLRAALRQDPDVILVGEMRDLDTISIAMTAAETGHLVMATLHAATAIQTVERVVDVFPPHQQDQIRIQLANTLLGIISQQLIPRADGNGRVLACEVLMANSAVRNLIRDNKTFQLNTVMQTGINLGMITMEKSLKSFLDRGLITAEEVKKRTYNPNQ